MSGSRPGRLGVAAEQMFQRSQPVLEPGRGLLAAPVSPAGSEEWPIWHPAWWWKTWLDALTPR